MEKYIIIAMVTAEVFFGVKAPEGSVAKITGKEGLVFSGVAKVYDSEELMMEGLNRKEITKGFLLTVSLYYITRPSLMNLF